MRQPGEQKTLRFVHLRPVPRLGGGPFNQHLTSRNERNKTYLIQHTQQFHPATLGFLLQPPKMPSRKLFPFLLPLLDPQGACDNTMGCRSSRHAGTYRNAGYTHSIVIVYNQTRPLREGGIAHPPPSAIVGTVSIQPQTPPQRTRHRQGKNGVQRVDLSVPSGGLSLLFGKERNCIRINGLIASSSK